MILTSPTRRCFSCPPLIYLLKESKLRWKASVASALETRLSEITNPRLSISCSSWFATIVGEAKDSLPSLLLRPELLKSFDVTFCPVRGEGELSDCSY